MGGGVCQSMGVDGFYTISLQGREFSIKDGIQGDMVAEVLLVLDG